MVNSAVWSKSAFWREKPWRCEFLLFDVLLTWMQSSYSLCWNFLIQIACVCNSQVEIHNQCILFGILLSHHSDTLLLFRKDSLCVLKWRAICDDINLCPLNIGVCDLWLWVQWVCCENQAFSLGFQITPIKTSKNTMRKECRCSVNK